MKRRANLKNRNDEMTGEKYACALSNGIVQVRNTVDEEAYSQSEICERRGEGSRHHVDQRQT